MKGIRGAHRALQGLEQGEIPPGEGVGALLEGLHGPRGDEKTPYRPLRGLIQAAQEALRDEEPPLRGLTGGARTSMGPSWGFAGATRT